MRLDFGDKAVLGIMVIALLVSAGAWYNTAMTIDTSVNMGVAVMNFQNHGIWLAPATFDWREITLEGAQRVRHLRPPTHCFDGMTACIEERPTHVTAIQ
jgi:hypothetical protein